MCGIDRNRREQRIEFLLAIFIDEAARLRVQFVEAEHPNSLLRHRGPQSIPALILIVDKLARQPR